MKLLTLIIAFLFLLGLSYPGRNLKTHDSGPEEVQLEEHERRDIHKPGRMNEDIDKEANEEEQDVKDADPEYDPVDDDLTEDEGVEN